MDLENLSGKKTAATKLGIPVEEYLQILNLGLKWCFRCENFLSRDFFTNCASNSDGKHHQCKDCENIARRRRYKAAPKEKKLHRPYSRTRRDGDKRQARENVHNLVRQGKMPHARTVPCTDCGHIGGDRVHEYDHYLGYEAINHLEVQVVCSCCHHWREAERKFADRS